MMKSLFLLEGSAGFSLCLDGACITFVSKHQSFKGYYLQIFLTPGTHQTPFNSIKVIYYSHYTAKRVIRRLALRGQQTGANAIKFCN